MQDYRALVDTRFQVGTQLTELRKLHPAVAAVKMHELMMQHLTEHSEVTKGVGAFIYTTFDARLFIN